MNVYDSARMADVLAPHGYRSVGSPDDADLVILNTCHIREKAAEKVYSELGRLRKIKTARDKNLNPMLIAVGGCVAQAEGEEIWARAPWVDIVFGPQTYHRLPEMLASSQRKEAVFHAEFSAEQKFDLPLQINTSASTSEYLTIQEGCNKFCTFCVVPYTRGEEFSRPSRNILREASQLIARGAREVTLLGQNVNAYLSIDEYGSKISLGELLFQLAELPNLERIRYTTSHPRDMHKELLDAHRQLPEVMPYVHLPVQSGSNSVLTDMNRRHTADDYRHAIDQLRTARPDIAISSDFIVGFPGESEADFLDTLTLVREVEYAQAYSFKYSARPGTPAAIMRKQVSEDEKKARLAELQNLLRQQQISFNKKFIGKTVSVLLERHGRHNGQLVGRSPHMQMVHVNASDSLLGKLVQVNIDGVDKNSLSGHLFTDKFQQPKVTN